MAETFPHYERPKNHESRTRLSRILGWHTRPEDAELTDFEFVKAVIRRWQEHQERPLIDPNE